MAYRLIKSLRYTAVIAEVIDIIKCVPVQYKVRHTELCYNKLPVLYDNHSLFIASTTRNLLKAGTVKNCNKLLLLRPA